MRPASFPIARYRTQASWRSRATSAALALALVALLILVLIRMGALPGGPRVDRPALSTFDVSSAGPKASESKAETRPQQTKRQAQKPRATPPPPALPPPPIVLPGVMTLSREDFAASNVGRFPKQAAAPGDAVASADAGGGGADGGTGSGPGGEKLYNAEWYRRPSRAEMVTYLPQTGQPGWGMIACRTIDRYHVEDCRELGETPGSGIARALRRASWQFLVRPPRVGGKPMIGAWVRIKFDLIQDAAD